MWTRVCRRSSFFIAKVIPKVINKKPGKMGISPIEERSTCVLICLHIKCGGISNHSKPQTAISLQVICKKLPFKAFLPKKFSLMEIEKRKESCT